MALSFRDRPLIMGQGEWAGEKLGWPRKKITARRGLPKLLCLMRGALKKIDLFHQIILVKETTIVEYLVLK